MSIKTAAEIDWLKDSQSFDKVSDLYDQYRPTYPTELIENILALTSIPARGQILEIGSGTGIATQLFAERGFRMHCIEPGQNLAQVAAQKLQDFPDVSFEHVRFEDWQEHAGRFDLVISAQAFHWVNGAVGYPKIARALKSNGHLALFWNMYPGFAGAVGVDLDRVYRERVPERIEKPEDPEELIKYRSSAITASCCFGPVRIKRFPWSVRYNCQQYLGLLNTYSDHLRLSEQTRQSLFEGVAEVIERHGGFIDRPYLAVLYVARKLA
jgi:SAM-dependent methyltransferase